MSVCVIYFCQWRIPRALPVTAYGCRCKVEAACEIQPGYHFVNRYRYRRYRGTGQVLAVHG